MQGEQDQGEDDGPQHLVHEHDNNTRSIDDSILLGRSFVQATIDALIIKFTDLGNFNAIKFFEPTSYPKDVDERESRTQEWLGKLLDKFCNDYHPVVKKELWLSEREEFVEQLYIIVTNKQMPKA